MIPDPVPTPPPAESIAPAPDAPTRSFTSRLLALAFVILCFEVGIFLIVFPWVPLWENNLVPTLAPWLEDVWGNPYFRGALSGVGVVNVYISFMEMVRLVRGAGA